MEYRTPNMAVIYHLLDWAKPLAYLVVSMICLFYMRVQVVNGHHEAALVCFKSQARVGHPQESGKFVYTDTKWLLARYVDLWRVSTTHCKLDGLFVHLPQMKGKVS